MAFRLTLPLRTKYTKTFDADVKEDVATAYRNRGFGRFKAKDILYVQTRFFLRNNGMLLMGRYRLAITGGLAELGLASAPEKVVMRREARLVPEDQERIELRLSTRRPRGWQVPS